MIYTFEQIQSIVKDNPSRDRINKGREVAIQLTTQVMGDNFLSAMPRSDYFESEEIYKEKQKCAMSNRDLFGRLLQQEDMIFAARDGSSSYGLPKAQEEVLNGILADVQNGMSLRKWVQTFALNVYRCDPYGVVFIEQDAITVDANGAMVQPRAYPTYKSIHCIHDYLPNGRKLEYICFTLTVGEAKAFGINDENFQGQSSGAKSNYYRFVDDAKDILVHLKEDTVSLATSTTQANPLPNPWKLTPGFVISDLVDYRDPLCFLSPLEKTVELAKTYMNDRATREIQKKLHGFAKAVEPLLKCPTCDDGYVDGKACPDCTPKGASKGTGYKLKTKVSDVAKFPLDIMEAASFDFRRIFGYVTPDIQSWEKQDTSLDDLEELMEMTYWGTVRMKRPKPGKQQGEAITATESDSNQQPKEARLNQTADWAEKVESLIAWFIGKYWFDGIKTVSVHYGRDYVLRTAAELRDQYESLRTQGAPASVLNKALRKYLQAELQNQPLQLAIELKKAEVEPFVHMNNADVEKSQVISFEDKLLKAYYPQWETTITNDIWLRTQPAQLREMLKAWVQALGIQQPKPVVIPGQPAPAQPGVPAPEPAPAN